MMDDVVGLVMIQIVAELGSGVIGGATVGRPVGASVGLLVGVVIMCRWVIGPFMRRFGGREVVGQKEGGKVRRVISRMDIGQGQMAFLVHTGVLLALISGASYAGTSVLFAAFLAGAAVSWWDKMIASSPSASTSPAETQEVSPEIVSPLSLSTEQPQPWTGARVYEHYYAPLAARILVPFFFASIGFSIPITQLFSGGTIWRGLVYALLMAAGKFMTGVWLLRFTVPDFILGPVERLRLVKKLGWRSATGPTPAISTASDTGREPEPENNEQPSSPTQFQSRPQSRSPSSSPPPPPAAPVTSPPQKPRSLYPPAIIGLAMIARGEIGFLIASVAEARGIFSSSASHSESMASSELYLIVVWATVLCTILGPVAVGLCVRRVKALERERVLKGGSGDGVLGGWGVEEGSG